MANPHHPSENKIPTIVTTGEQPVSYNRVTPGWYFSPNPTLLPPYDPNHTYNLKFYKAYVRGYYEQAQESLNHADDLEQQVRALERKLRDEAGPHVETTEAERGGHDQRGTSGAVPIQREDVRTGERRGKEAIGGGHGREAEARAVHGTMGEHSEDRAVGGGREGAIKAQKPEEFDGSRD